MVTTSVNINNLTRGLMALSSASDFGWFHGHFGAAVIASELLIEECGLDSELAQLVRDRAEVMIGSESYLFKELPSSNFDPNWKEKIVKAISNNLERLRISGHGVIYGTLALKVLEKNERLATEHVISGILKLLNLTTHDNLNRYYGIENYDNVTIEPEDKVPVYNSEVDLIRIAFRELDSIYPDQDVNGKHYFFAGCKLHAITHAHALCLLNEIGYSDLARKGYKNHRLQIKLNRHTPPNSTKLKANKIFSPLEKSYWERDLNEPHYFKFPYSVLSLLKKLPDKEANEYLQRSAVIWSM